ncbi:MAG: hypothetical protein LQ341_002931, partial [Variospora aurantia]
MDFVLIDENGELLVEVVQTGNDPSAKTGSFTRRFQVNRDVLIKASPVLRAMLATICWKEGSSDVVSLGEGFVAVTELWLRVVHDVKLVRNLLFPEIWLLVQAIDYYALDIKLFKAWFADGYTRNAHLLVKPAELLFPTWRFDHAKGFAECTRDLAYREVRHITEPNPSNLIQYHLPMAQIQQMNAAKGRLRTILFLGLWKPCQTLFERSCTCRKATLYDYQAHLVDIGVWPLEKMFGANSINNILDKLTKFSYEAANIACHNCRQDYKTMIRKVIVRTRTYFDGLCLDCIDKSKPKTGDVDLDYWMHAKLEASDWSRGCRFVHDEPT